MVEEADNSRESVEQPGKEKAQYGGNINTKSFLNSNSQVGMEGISHEIIKYSIPNISKSTLQSDLVTPTVQDLSNDMDLFPEKLKEIDTEISKFDSLGHASVGGSIPCNYAAHDAPPPTPHSRAIINHPISIQLQNSTLTEVPILTDISLLHPSTWKRLARLSHDLESFQVTYSSSKRPSSSLHDTNELPSTRRMVSQVDSGSFVLLVGIDIQPYQEP